MLRVAMKDQAAFSLEASVLHGKADPMCHASQAAPIHNIPFQTRLMQDPKTKGTAAEVPQH